MRFGFAQLFQNLRRTRAGEVLQVEEAVKTNNLFQKQVFLTTRVPGKTSALERVDHKGLCALWATQLLVMGLQQQRIARTQQRGQARIRRQRNEDRPALPDVRSASSRPLPWVLAEYSTHYHSERNHQGKSNKLLFPNADDRNERGHPVECRHRLGGLLKYYRRAA